MIQEEIADVAIKIFSEKKLTTVCVFGSALFSEEPSDYDLFVICNNGYHGHKYVKEKNKFFDVIYGSENYFLHILKNSMDPKLATIINSCVAIYNNGQFDAFFKKAEPYFDLIRASEVNKSQIRLYTIVMSLNKIKSKLHCHQHPIEVQFQKIIQDIYFIEECSKNKIPDDRLDLSLKDFNKKRNNIFLCMERLKIERTLSAYFALQSELSLALFSFGLTLPESDFNYDFNKRRTPYHI